MANVTKYRNGVPSWADVAVDDIDGCARFYSELFGWEPEDQGDDAGRYHMFRIDGSAAAGMGQRQSGDQPPLWSAYISVDDLDATLAAAEAAGGVVVMPRMDIFTSGSMAVVIDPSGAAVSFWQPGDHIGAEVVNVANTLAWHELTTRKPEAAMKFYGDVLGWQFQGMPSDPDEDPSGGTAGYQMIMVGERLVGGLMPMEGDEWGDLPSHWMIYFAVDDTDRVVGRVSELGGAISVPAFDIPIGRVAVCNDPDGNAFSVIAFAGPPDEIDGGVA